MQPTKRPGRPRRDPRPLRHPPEEEILQAAGRLFAAQGFAGTSTRQIARAAGLQQPSLFHYYPTKEDILRALSERALVRPLRALERVAATEASPGVKLFCAVMFHVRHLCSQPYDLTAVLEDAPRLPRQRFRNWFEQVDRYTRGVRELVEAGQREGAFVADLDPAVATMAILGMANWTLRWFRQDGRLLAEDVAEQMARMAVRAVLRDHAALGAIAHAGRELAGRLDLEGILGG